MPSSSVAIRESEYFAYIDILVTRFDFRLGTIVSNLGMKTDNILLLIDYVLKYIESDETRYCIMELCMKDDYTFQHSIDVGALACAMCLYMGKSEEECFTSAISGILHDLGKIDIPSKILMKNGKLTSEEFEIIKTHSAVGYEYVKKDLTLFSNMCLGILEHHERVDGKGYPDGKTENDISEFGKILAVCDVFEAITGYRIYREPMSIEKAFTVMYNDIGHFDIKILDTLFNMYRDANGNIKELRHG